MRAVYGAIFHLPRLPRCQFAVLAREQLTVGVKVLGLVAALHTLGRGRRLHGVRQGAHVRQAAGVIHQLPHELIKVIVGKNIVQAGRRLLLGEQVQLVVGGEQLHLLVIHADAGQARAQLTLANVVGFGRGLPAVLAHELGDLCERAHQPLLAAGRHGLELRLQ